MKKVKNTAKKIIRKIYGVTDEKIRNIDYNYEYIAFDIYDTLLFRNVYAPDDVFKILEHEYKEKYGKSDNVCKKRIEAEDIARKNKTGREITFDEIYNHLTVFSNEQKEFLKNKELELEYNLTVVNPYMKDVFDKLKSDGKKIIIISDMYLPFAFIKKLLDKCEITGYEKLYLSSDIGSTKSSGELFDYVKKDLKIEPKQILHIGDNVKSDFYMAKKKGFNAILYKASTIKYSYRAPRKTVEKLSDDEKLYYEILDCFIKNTKKISDDNYYNVGYEVLGPILLGYAAWLKNEVTSRNYDKIWFLAREGAIYKKVFEMIYPNTIANEYIYISRLAVCRARMHECTNYNEMYDTFIALSRNVKTVKDYLKLLGFSYEKIKNKFVEYGIDINDNFWEYKEKEKLFNAIKKEGESFFEEQNKLFKRYMNDSGIENCKIAISDIGWSGTMQLMIKRFFDNADIAGFYMGVSNIRKSDEFNNLKRFGYWFAQENTIENFDKLRFSTINFETLFLSKDGTTIGYKTENDKVVSILGESDNDEVTMKKLNITLDAAYEFIENMLSNKSFKVIENVIAEHQNIAFANYDKFAVYPSGKSVEFYKGMKFLDGVKKTDIVYEKSILHAMSEIKKTKKIFENNIGKTIWLKSLFKISFPYFELLKFLLHDLKLKTDVNKKYSDNDKRKTA